MSLADVALDDKYRLEHGRVFLTGVQALVRLPMLQQLRDRAAGLRTAGFVSGYRGSPLGGLDTALHEAQPFLAQHRVRFRPAVNEELAATAIWGTQQLHLMPGEPDCDGIFGLWYGKGPGVDRCGDVFKHANYAGTSRHGGVLVVAGDDHAARSSAVAHQSEHIFSACALPVLAPASVQDILDYGLHGWAMSRYTGCWVAMKLSADVVESSATVEVDVERVRVQQPADFALPADGVHIRWPDPQLAQEHRMQAYKIYAAAAYARANALDRIVLDSPRARLGLIACGKAWLDLRQALDDLGIDAARAAALGLRVCKVAMPWPLEAAGVRRFATGLEEILVVEEKRQIIEYQLKEMLYNWRDDVRPRVLGKFDEAGEWPAPHGQWLLPPTGEMTPLVVARALASRLARIDAAGGWRQRALALGGSAAGGIAAHAPLQRTPYFCSGCPHNRSTVVPEGSCALAGVGCHLMVLGMERSTLTISQMGGEGATWIGMAEHAGVQHVFANMGDGTYFHSGLLAIRAAVAAGVNITYKLLFNDAVAMTGGQPVDGPLTVPRLTQQVHAEGVARIVVVADDVHKYPRDTGFAAGVQLRARDELDAVQRELRAVPGVTVLVYDQVCATEARRRRKRGLLPPPRRQVVIHEAVCDGCGDCSVQSNCLSIVPVDTEFGTKRAIDPYTCNLDESCLLGCCPALVTVEGASREAAAGGHGLPVDDAALPEPALRVNADACSLLIAGTGGTGVVTLGALLGMAAHLEGRAATVLDQTGLAQKGGAVLTHVRFAASPAALASPRIVRADVLLGVDLLVAAGDEALQRLRADHTRAVINSAAAITGQFVRHAETLFPRDATLALLRGRVAEADALDATQLAAALAGHSIATNLFLLGFAWQRGLVPVGRDALLRAIELNGTAVDDNRRAFAWGRRAALDREAVLAQAAAARPLPPSQRLSAGFDEMLARRRAALVAYQGEALARRYVALVERVRAAEHAVQPGSERLADAVARQAHRLYAVKDEYEVARLFADDPSLELQLAERFAPGFRVHYHLSLPWQRTAAGGRPRKRAFGPWLRVAMRVLAAAKVLRATPLDPFGWSAERSDERAFAREYETVVERLLLRLDAAHLEAAIEIARLPDEVRGFGVVRRQRMAAVRQRLAARQADYDALGAHATAPAGVTAAAGEATAAGTTAAAA
ncbi:MAG: indolepyruvate ferredoxin oxidoreductase family protein [Ideonella sp.]|nr:indolepyruvate ferredoxin oxidoreductase family protein [Ideonella sp.]MCC7457300.1 indolepyruvate ferredoxin oxidoreductase family protein [Nitrospira sp.]